MKGYHGHFLKVDLNSKSLSNLTVSDDDYRKYIGGSSLGAKLIYNSIKKNYDPMAPESPLIFSTGPFTGTSIPMVSRYAACGISPLTGYWGEATSGGVFPVRLKCSGYDGIFITGKSDKPVYLYINNGNAEIKDAAHIWGKDSYETQDIIKKELGNKKISVACIGGAGEKLNKHAGIMNDQGRAAGRCGLGALMGSKNLKAVAVTGNMRPDISDKNAIKDVIKEAMPKVSNSMMSVMFREYGTLSYMDMGMLLGDTPAKYFQKSVFPAEKISGEALRQAYPVERYACLGCPVGCGRVVKNFRKDIPDVDGPEYETAGAFGPLCMNTDLDSIIESNHLCNVHGLDTISTGVSIAYAMYLYEKDIITPDMAGMEIKWGDGKVVVNLVKMIINQEGIGKLLSKGTLAMARALGRNEEEAAQVKGLEIPMHDGRAYHGLAISYATGPRGACHLKGDYYNVDIGAATMIPELDIMPGERMSSENKSGSAARLQSIADTYDALILCKFTKFEVAQICRLLSAVTGWDITPPDLLEMGDRSINIKRAINNKLGLTQKDDKLPEICLKPLEEGRTAGSRPDMDLLLKDYYHHRKWDLNTGMPTKEVLTGLGLEDVAQDLYS